MSAPVPTQKRPVSRPRTRLPNRHEAALTGWRRELHEVIFEAETPLGRAFDVGLFIAIITSTFVVILESVADVKAAYGGLLIAAEWVFTGAFTLEYVLRLLAVRKPFAYARSFFGIIDILSILPSFLVLFFAGTHSLLAIRMLRLVRVFRVLKLARYVSESKVLTQALIQSRPKITVFLLAVLTIVVIVGALMYLIEPEDGGFTSIPAAMYWAVVTMTTVGYGDLAPITPLGKFCASVLMIMGYGIIAVPTGIVTAELAQAGRAAPVSTRVCDHCGSEGHDIDSRFCRHCGGPLSLEGPTGG